MRAYSQDLRDRVFADYDAGLTFAELGRKYRVTPEWVRQIVRRRERTGETGPRPAGAKKRPFHERHEADLRRETTANPSHTLETLRAALGLDVSIGTLWTALHALKISFKKTARRGRAGPPGRRRQAGRVRGLAAPARPGPVRLPRRDLGEDQYDPDPRVGADRRAVD
jgi:transposase